MSNPLLDIIGMEEDEPQERPVVVPKHKKKIHGKLMEIGSYRRRKQKPWGMRRRQKTVSNGAWAM